MRVLHVRCGDDLRAKLPAAGFAGDYLSYVDPLCQGPVPGALAPEAFRRVRAAFIAAELRHPFAAALERLTREDDALDAAAAYDRLVLWFEHDLYDQAILIKVLATLADCDDLRARAQLVLVDRFPGVRRFIGLGQLRPEQLATLREAARPVTAEAYDLAARAWGAFSAPEPEPLAAFAETPGLPPLAPALRRHCREFPWTRDGLSLTERLCLGAVAQGAATPSAIFVAVQEAEDAPFLGDLMLWPVLRRLAGGDTPALALGGNPPEGRVALTPFGRRLLAGGARWRSPPRWVGGVDLGRQAWLWDDDAGRFAPA